MSWGYSDEIESREFEAEKRRMRDCRCPHEMPGVCPGPHFCPMEQDRSEEDES